MAVAGGVVVEPDRDIAVVDADELVFDQHPRWRVGIAEQARRPRVVDLGENAVLHVEAELVVDRHSIVGVVEISDRNAPVVEPGQLGLKRRIFGRRGKVHRNERPGLGQQVSLVGMPRVSAAVKSGDQAAVVDSHQIIEGGIGRIVECLESVVHKL